MTPPVGLLGELIQENLGLVRHEGFYGFPVAMKSLSSFNG